MAPIPPPRTRLAPTETTVTGRTVIPVRPAEESSRSSWRPARGFASFADRASRMRRVSAWSGWSTTIVSQSGSSTTTRPDGLVAGAAADVEHDLAGGEIEQRQETLLDVGQLHAIRSR